MKKENLNLLNDYLADLFVFTAKLHNLHWNVVGKSFLTIHKFTDDMYNYVFEYQDDIAELIKMENDFPLVRLDEAIKKSNIKELDSKAFDYKEVISILINDLEYMIKTAKNIRTILAEEDNFIATNMIEDQVAKYKKDLWILKSYLV